MGNARDAIARAESFEPDVILLDIGLPEMDGYELARRRIRRAFVEATGAYDACTNPPGQRVEAEFELRRYDSARRPLQAPGTSRGLHPMFAACRWRV